MVVRIDSFKRNAIKGLTVFLHQFLACLRLPYGLWVPSAL
ncbi:hypothetical protein CtesDRAFT_PD0798 [Comamonas testosteroni KF-1]|uniref:Uncharacterized protein n=1 Tax=Comamonas testosteroni (strain DSM 14576 / KF-1) TaxID=399795 RepID=B7WWE9_COMTK|nr:hypothetical protein CtesDRAFT_PD0798 [Comamonas testosteroni KF-1]